MSKERNAFKAGLFIVVSVVLAVAVIVSISGTGRLLGPSETRAVRFKLTDDLGGLRVGDDVRVGGYKVGSVRSVELVGADGDPRAAAAAEPGLLVTFSMPKKYVLRDGARVGVQTTLTGASVLNVDDMGRGGPIADGVALAGAPDPKTALLASLGKAGPGVESIVANVNTQTLPRVNKFVDHLDAKIDPVVEKYDNVTDRTGEMMAEVRDLVGDTKGDFRGTMANLNATTNTFKEKTPELLDRMNGVMAKVDDSLKKLQTSLDDVNKTMANARDLSASAKALIAGNRGKLDGMVSGLKVTSDNLKAASAEIRRSPWRLLYKPGAGEMANLNLYDSARQFAEGAGALNDASTALRDALDRGDAKPEEVRELVEKLEASFNGFKQVEDKLWSSVRE